jgi:peptide/nickel transport system substrate-binding protein
MTFWTRRRFLTLIVSQAVMVAACGPSQSAPAAPAKPAEAPKPTEAAKPAAPAATTAPAAAAPAKPAEAKPADAKPTEPAKPAAAAAPAKPGGKDEIVVVQSADIANIDPSRAALVHVFNLGHSVLDTLAYLDRSMKIQPRLATSWKSLDDKTWEVKLRTGVKFHDGSPFEAAAVKASFDYQTAADAASKTFFINWESAEVVDPTTVRFKTKAPDPFFPNVLTRLWVFSPNDLKDPTVFATKMNGTGPYKITEIVKGDRISLAANAEYWAGAPKIGKVVFRSAPEASARVAMLQAGQADIIVNVPVEQAKLIEGDANLRLATVQGLRGIPIMIDERDSPPLKEVKVRQAMNYAVDRDAIVKNILGGYAVQQPATISALLEGNNPDVKPYPYDQNKAKQLLSEAGYANGFDLTFHHPTGRWMKDAEVAQAMAQMLGRVGIKVTLETAEYSTFFAAWSKGEYRGMTMIGVTNPDGAPASLFNLFLYSKGAWPFSFSDEKLDKMIEESRSTMDKEKRIKVYQEMEQYLHDNAAWIFTYEQKDLYGVNKALKWEPAPNEMIYLWDATF